MELENVKFGLSLATGMLFIMFAFFASYYTLYEISLNQALKGSRKYLWSAVALFLPGVGPFTYYLLVKKPEYSGSAQR